MKVSCKKCGNVFEIEKAIEAEIIDQLKLEAESIHRQDVQKWKLEEQKKYEQLTAKAIEKEREDISFRLKENATQLAQSQERNDRNEKRLEELLDSLRRANAEKDELKIKAAQDLNAKIEEIREKAGRDADERCNTEIKALKKTIEQMKDEVERARQTAAQGSEQMQGEVLEIEIKNKLRAQFPFDIIEDIKTGVRGADIKQTVRNSRFEECGIILWEIKNAKWSDAWIDKLKEDVNTEKAGVGVIVSRFLHKDFDEIHNVENKGLIWVANPKNMVVLAGILRTMFFSVYEANKGLNIDDDVMKRLYDYLSSPDFRNRVEVVIKNHKALMNEINKEKIAAEKRWAKQEKYINGIMKNTVGFYGDLQGIAGSRIQDIPLLEGDEDDDEDV